MMTRKNSNFFFKLIKNEEEKLNIEKTKYNE